MGYDFERLNERFDNYLKMGLPFYDCVIMKDGKCLYRRVNGYIDLENKLPAKGKEIFNVYSCSKLITCVAALKLYEKGLYDLDDKLSDYMPEFSKMTVMTESGTVEAKNPITIRRLFTMTAGFSYDVWSPSLQKCVEETKGLCPTREAMKYLAKEPLLFEPGERWEYSLCHDVLAALVEVLSGQRFADFVKENVFKPLGMTHTSFKRSDFGQGELIKQYRYNKETGALSEVDNGNVLRIGTEYDSGGAGCITSTEDYILFIEAVRKAEVFAKRETLDLLTENALSAKQAETLWANDLYGYSLGQRCPKGDGKRTDFGWDGMAGAYYAIDVKNALTVFFGTQVLGAVDFNLSRHDIIAAINEVVLK